MSLAFEGRNLAFRQRIEEAVGYLELAPIGAEAAVDRLRQNGSQACNRNLAADDNNLLPGLGALDQARQVRLGSMDSDGGHCRQIG